MLPQFAQAITYKFNHENLSFGLTIFTFDLFKKVIIAYTLANYASPVFAAAEHGVTLTFFEAWCGALGYTFQLYFDFSGYSDMAIGLGRMIGIRLSLNFNSPYKAVNIFDFWQRWHTTLSRFCATISISLLEVIVKVNFVNRSILWHRHACTLDRLCKYLF